MVTERSTRRFKTPEQLREWRRRQNVLSKLNEFSELDITELKRAYWAQPSLGAMLKSAESQKGHPIK